ncbi:MAG TPA: bifunctional riboflavin kinase/FAD synthetase [Xanthobacteraceae bacterium]|nr:bifunctional riboflavin kinase/FAD synthetase [Xanthobacteraceae bacterium]
MPTAARTFTVVRGGARDAQPAGALTGAVVAIGNFEGVHQGHRAVIDQAVRLARRLGKPAAVLTFEPHPRAFFRPDEPIFRLSDERAKLRLLAATDLDGAVVVTFDDALAQLPAEEFVGRILCDWLKISGAVVGFDFHFGKGRGGSPQFLADEGRRRGFAVEIVPEVKDAARRFSSGAIRAALAAGDVADAAALLGYPWFVSGEVIHGEKRGRELGFPTANLRLDPGCGLRHGIYAVKVAVEGRRYGGVASFGRRPTFDNGAPLLEIFLFDFAGDLYSKTIDVAFVGWIRPEEKFASIEALVARMNADARTARAMIAASGEAFPPLRAP